MVKTSLAGGTCRHLHYAIKPRVSPSYDTHKPKLYPKIELKKHQMHELCNEINAAFLKMIDRHREKALLGPSYLRELVQNE